MEGEPLDSIDLGYICGNCIEKEKRKIVQEQYQIKETRENKLRQLMSENRSCPYCGRLLRIRMVTREFSGVVVDIPVASTRKVLI